MPKAATKLPAKAKTHAGARTPAVEVWRPFESLRREVERLFEDFDRGLWWPMPFGGARSFFDIEPELRGETSWGEMPLVDMVEKDGAYEVTAELPGLSESDIDVKVVNGVLTIKGEKQEDKEETKKDYYLRERHIGAFERSFRLPDGVDVDKIEATYKDGILTLTLPKTPEAQKAEKKIAVKAA